MENYSIMNAQDRANYKDYLKTLIRPVKSTEGNISKRTFVTLVNNKNIERELANFK